MKRRLSWIVIVLVLLAGALPVRASSIPVIAGNVAGFELCPQSVCGAAIFAAIFSGQVGNNPYAFGTVAVAITHAPLPDPGDTAAILGGTWSIRLLSGRTFTGVATGGSLFNNGDNTYHVMVNMLLTGGGAGALTFEGTLSHRVFPPTIVGRISQ